MKNKVMDMFPHYWICMDCAKQKGGTFPKNHVCTVVADSICEYCNKQKDSIVPFVDFDWEDKVITLYARGARD
ncbi:MAG: hypothetical protein ACK5XN_37805 [Bacteroidota bacterium]|jgi:hypothetical protein